MHATTVGQTECGRALARLLLYRQTSRRVNEMTEAADITIAEALALIDQGLGLTMSRDLMSTNEVADLLLDVRSILAAAPADVAETPVPAPIA